MPEQTDFLQAFRGSFTGILRWPQLDDFWKTLLQEDSQDWYIYAVGETPPEETADRQQLEHFITGINELLRKEHQQDYCGVIYVDDFQHPAFIKIFDPNNLGVSCGFSDFPPLPGWILSVIKPTDLPSAIPQPGNRKRWWQKIFG